VKRTRQLPESLSNRLSGTIVPSDGVFAIDYEVDVDVIKKLKPGMSRAEKRFSTPRRIPI
jgi:hypothetical protein